MFIRNKLWLGLGIALVAGAGCSKQDDKAAEHQGHQSSLAIINEGGEGGEAGEGGEGGEGASAGKSVVESDALYLTSLALMRGHLSVGVDLYRKGAHEAAQTHMKHPEDELYVALQPGLEARGAAGFTEQLSTLADAVAQRSSVEDVEAAYASLLQEISRAEAAAGTQEPAVLGEVIHSLVKTAADEYDIAVEDGRLVNAHEYQDALGFVRTAQELTDHLAKATDNQAAVKEIRAQLDALAPAWPTIVPPEQLETPPSRLYGAAASIELAVHSL